MGIKNIQTPNRNPLARKSSFNINPTKTGGGRFFVLIFEGKNLLSTRIWSK
jgi:hypothetical protein